MKENGEDTDQELDKAYSNYHKKSQLIFEKLAKLDKAYEDLPNKEWKQALQHMSQRIARVVEQIEPNATYDIREGSLESPLLKKVKNEMKAIIGKNRNNTPKERNEQLKALGSLATKLERLLEQRRKEETSP